MLGLLELGTALGSRLGGLDGGIVGDRVGIVDGQVLGKQVCNVVGRFVKMVMGFIEGLTRDG